MRIGLITPGISANEQDWCIPALRHLVRQLARTHDVRVLALRYPFEAGSYPLFGAHVTALGGKTLRKLGNLWLWQATLRALARLHREQAFDVLHVFWATESGALAAIAGRMLGIPVVVNIAGGELARLPGAGYGGQLVASERAKIRVALSLANLVVSGSHWSCHMAEPFLRPGQACLNLPLGVDLDLFSSGDLQPAPGPPRLVHAASLVPVKDQATLLRALAIVRESGQAYTAEIAGEGILEGQLHSLTNELGLTQQVQFRGPVAHDQLPERLRGATAFVLSSLHESQCMAVLEAAACGVPTVGSAVGVVPELAPRAALAVPSADPAALAAAITAVLRDPALQRRMAAASVAAVREQWSLERCAERTVAAYTGLLAGRR